MAAVDIVMLVLIAALFVYAHAKKINPYEAFAEGASEAVPTIIKILPYLSAMLVAINLFRSSGAMDALSKLLAPVLKRIGIPAELITLIVLRPFSGSASLALLQDTLLVHGADSFINCCRLNGNNFLYPCAVLWQCRHQEEQVCAACCTD